MKKGAYSAPRLVSHGKLEALTHANSPINNNLDASFPTGTPFNQLTFS